MAASTRHAWLLFGVTFVVMLVLVHVNIQVPALGHLGSAGIALWFLLTPDVVASRRGQTLADWGLAFGDWRRDLGWGLAYIVVVTPLFFVGFVGFYDVVCKVPQVAALAPRGMCAAYVGLEGMHLPALTTQFAEFVLVQLVVVALPEELFFRGMMLGLLREGAATGATATSAPRGMMVAGVRMDGAVVVCSLMFAAVHLPKDGDPRALATFFPALVFAWLRLKTGGLVAPVVAHAYSNILVRLLELSLLR